MKSSLLMNLKKQEEERMVKTHAMYTQARHLSRKYHENHHVVPRQALVII